MTTRLFLCACGSPQHQLLLQTDPEGTLPRLSYLTVHLSPLPLWRRLWVALRYVCGRRSQWGAFEEIALNPETATDLADALHDAVLHDAPDLFFSPNDVH